MLIKKLPGADGQTRPLDPTGSRPLDPNISLPLDPNGSRQLDPNVSRQLDPGGSRALSNPDFAEPTSGTAKLDALRQALGNAAILPRNTTLQDRYEIEQVLGIGGMS